MPRGCSRWRRSAISIRGCRIRRRTRWSSESPRLKAAAGSCLVGNSDICTLAKALCLGSHPRGLIAYWTSTFWIGSIVLSISLLTTGRTKAV